MDADLDATVKAWGNSYGIIIPAELARSLGLRAGERVHVHISHEPGRNDPDSLPTWDLGGDYDVDALLDEELGA